MYISLNQILQKNMKTLYLVRHAKSSWNNASLSDFERPLNDRGNADKKVMAKRLKEKETELDFILSSSAKRTSQTTYAIKEELSISSENIKFSDNLYHASLVNMLSETNSVSDDNDIIMLVGHNPGMSNLCDYLCDYFVDFPTLGIAKITFELDSWQEISRGTGTLEWFDFPKNN